MRCCGAKPSTQPSSNAEVTSGSTSMARPRLAHTFHRKEVSSMLRLKINLRVRRSVRVKCPRHSRYNPERDGAGAIRGGCRYCQSIYELYASKLAAERSLQALEQQIARYAVFNVAVFRK